MKIGSAEIIALDMENARQMASVFVIMDSSEKIVQLEYANITAMVNEIVNIGRGQCHEGKCFCIPGFEGEACEKKKPVKSLVECASQCVDSCMKNCAKDKIVCYTECSNDCSKR